MLQLTSGLSRRVAALGVATLVLLFLYLTLAGSPSSTSSPTLQRTNLSDLADRVAALEMGIESDRAKQDQELRHLREKVAKLEADAVPWRKKEQVKDRSGKDVVEGGNDVAMPPECQAMWMADGDKKTFVRTLASRKVQQYVEWGGGGSTLCASRLVANVTTIEHNKGWCASLREQLKANNVTNVNLICSHVAWHSFGETPEGDGTYEQFQDYVDMVNTLDIPHFDVVFIDGRARVACAKKALSYVSRSSVVLVHDWERMHYQPIRAWYDLIDKPHNQLALLQKKPT